MSESETPSDTLLASFATMAPGRIAGVEMLRELPHGIAVYAVRLYRSMMLWAAEPVAERAKLFESEIMARLAHELAGADGTEAARQPLILIAAELASSRPDLERIGRGCLAFTDWALQRHAVQTAVLFMDAAACVAPMARYALLAGRMHRRHGDAKRAELWLHQAFRVAHREKDWLTKARSLLSLGSMRINSGRWAEARWIIRRALKVAVRHRLRELIGESYHDLFVVAVGTGDHQGADTAIREAIGFYGLRHDRLPYFAHDIAFYWIERKDPHNAVKVLRALLERHWRNEPASRILAIGTTLRALGACGTVDAFETLQEEFRALLGQVEPPQRRAQALLAAGLGAMSLNRWTTAEEHLAAAFALANASGLHQEELEAERALDQVRERRHATATAVDPRGRAEVARRAVKVLTGGAGRRLG